MYFSPLSYWPWYESSHHQRHLIIITTLIISIVIIVTLHGEMQELKNAMNCQFMFCFHVKTLDFEREGRFFDGGRKLFGTTFTKVTILITSQQTGKPG